MKILVFLHGTAIMHRSGLGRTREERVRQVRDGEASIRDFASYVPVEGAVPKLRAWEAQGAEIVYLSPHLSLDDVEKDRLLLTAHGFPQGQVFFRQNDDEYWDVAERVSPDVLVEDDCESIGGEQQMTCPHFSSEARAKTKSIVVREFGGLEHLPDDVSALLAWPDRWSAASPGLNAAMRGGAAAKCAREE
jgi:hypothetical protein